VSGTYGIEVENTTRFTTSDDLEDRLDNVEIRDVTTTDWPGSVALRGVNRSTVSEIEVRNATTAVFYEYGNTTDISAIQATSGIEGTLVSINDVTDATVSDVTIARVGGDNHAVEADSSPDVVFEDISIDDRSNTDEPAFFGTPSALRVRDSPRATVRNSTIRGVDMVGVRFDHLSTGVGTPDALLANNTVVDATDVGIELRRSDRTVVRGNALTDTDGIQLVDSTSITVRSNHVRGEGVGDVGVSLSETDRSAIVANHIDGPFRGIEITDTDPSRVANNYINDTTWAIDVEGGAGSSYDGLPIHNTTIEGGDLRFQSYQNVTISTARITDGRIIVEVGTAIDQPRNVTVADTTITDNHADPAIDIQEASEITIENVTATGGLEHALRLDTVGNASVDGFTVTGQRDAGEESLVRLVWLSSVDNTTIRTLNVTDNPVTGDDASSFISGGVTALDVRHTDDTVIRDVDVRNNTHGTAPALSVRGTSTTVQFDSVRVAPAESGAVEVQGSTSGVSATDVTVGAGTPRNATLSFTASGVRLNDTTAPPPNAGATSIDRYFDAENLTTDAFLDVTLHYTAADATGVDESTLSLWNHDGVDWTELSSATVDTGADTVSANLTSFSTFGAFGESVPGSTPTATSTATPTATPTPSSTPTATPTSTPISSATPTPSSTVTSTPSPTPVDTRTEGPGFGALAALAALAVLAAALIANRR
jgi:parallel beta-helix repeat protein